MGVNALENRTVFVSHATADQEWARRVAEHLRHGGHEVELDVTDWRVGADFMRHMEEALDRAGTMVALWSRAYFSRDGYAAREWRAALAAGKRVVPLRIEKVRPPAMYCAYLYQDLFGRGEDEARQALLDAVGGRSMGAASALPEPGRGTGLLPAVWNVPGRSAVFTGRDDLLERLSEQLRAGERTRVQALCGAGGIGKTQLAVEYAHPCTRDSAHNLAEDLRLLECRAPTA